MTTLRMPANYVEINSEEMTYIAGGYYTLCSESTFASAVNTAVIVGMLCFTSWATVGKTVAKFGKDKVMDYVKAYLIKRGASTTTALAVVNVLGEWVDWSVGKAVACLTDKYDANRNDDKINF